MATEEVDWDLNAVVRRFTTTTAAAADRTSSSSAVNSDDPLPFLDIIGNGSQSQSSGPFAFPELLQPRSNGLDELQQLLRPFFIPSDNNSSSNGANSSLYGQMYEQQGCAMNMPPQIMIQPPPPSTVIFPGGVFRGGNQPQPPVPVQSQTPRSRKRKNQVKKSVCHVTGENLSSDLWAWRKYGQKPIKGSPFPRNYYRCSSSKGCTARKQVEKSTTDQNVFIVTYTGEHSHPRPTHRNSLAGSTRNKFTNTLLKPTGAAPEPTPAGNEDFKPSIPAVCGLSPTTPLTVPVTNEEPVLSMDDMDDIDGMEEDDDLLIPNAMTSEDFFTFGASPYKYNSPGENFPFSQS